MKVAVSKSSILSQVEAFARFFAYPLRISSYIELINPLWSSHRLMARVEKIRDETENVRTLTLRPGIRWQNHRAGQCLSVCVPIAGKLESRLYTISSPPERNDGCITITVKAIAGEDVSHRLVHHTQAGTYLEIGPPGGDFFLPDPSPVKLLFITAGIGVTPVMSMVSSLIAQGRLPNCVHIHYSPNDGDVVFGKKLNETAQLYPHYRLHLVFTQAFKRLKSINVHFSPNQLNRLCPDWMEREGFACGPEPLLTALENHYERAGMSDNLHTERFNYKKSAISSQSAPGCVRFARSGLAMNANDGASLLCVAENAGLRPPYGCRKGICHTCDAKLLSGCVRDLRTGKIFNDVGGSVRICICAAAGDCELDL